MDLIIADSRDVEDVELCKQVYDILIRHYPNHMWIVGANSLAGTVDIRLPYNSDTLARGWGYMLHIPSLKQHDEMNRKVMRAGGELLERFNIKRGRADRDVWDQARSNKLILTGGMR